MTFDNNGRTFSNDEEMLEYLRDKYGYFRTFGGVLHSFQKQKPNRCRVISISVVYDPSILNEDVRAKIKESPRLHMPYETVNNEHTICLGRSWDTIKSIRVSYLSDPDVDYWDATEQAKQEITNLFGESLIRMGEFGTQSETVKFDKDSMLSCKPYGYRVSEYANSWGDVFYKPVYIEDTTVYDFVSRKRVNVPLDK